MARGVEVAGGIEILLDVWSCVIARAAPTNELYHKVYCEELRSVPEIGAGAGAVRMDLASCSPLTAHFNLPLGQRWHGYRICNKHIGSRNQEVDRKQGHIPSELGGRTQ